MKRLRRHQKLFLIGLLPLVGIAALFLFSKTHRYHCTFEVKFDNSRSPYIDLSIDKNNYPMMLDLGSRLEMTMYTPTLEKMAKYPYGTETWKNFRGKEFTHNTYTVPQIELGPLVFKNPIIAEETLEEKEEYIMWKNPNIEIPPPKTVGVIGRGLLKKVNLLFDTQNSTLIVTNSLKQLKQEGYDIKSFLKAPFQITSKGIILKIGTDLGFLKFLLDTGATSTILHDDLYPAHLEKEFSQYDFPTLVTTTFKIQNMEFGSKRLYFIKMTDLLRDIDGILGMDFVENHVLYIDFPKKYIYIQKPLDPKL